MEQEEKTLNEKVGILKKYLDEGKLKIPRDPLIISSLKQIRIDSEGNVDPSSVNSLVRAMANATLLIHREEELRKIPLIDVHRKYIEILEEFFSNPFKEMVKHNLTPGQIAQDMSETESIVEAFKTDSEHFEAGMKDFWRDCAPIVQAHINQLNHLKGVYGGDFFPTYGEKVVTSVGLYVDTIVLPDPMIKALSMHKILKPDRALFYLTKHALTALSLRDILLADVNPPIAVISPDRLETDPNYVRFLQSMSVNDTRSHLEKIFGRKFSNNAELEKFLVSIPDSSSLIPALKDPKRLLYDLDYQDLPIEEQLKKAEKMREQFPEYSLKSQPLGKVVKFETMGRMMQINEVVQKSRSDNGIPLMDAPTSWQYLLWKYEYDKEASDKVDPGYKSMLVANALTQKQFSWLGNVPVSDLVRLRKQGALKDIRDVLDKGISEIQTADESSFSSILTEVSRNIEGALENHRKNIEDNSSEIRSLGKNVREWAVDGSISLAAGLLHNEAATIAASLFGAIKGGKGAVEIAKKGISVVKKRRKINNSAMGILFKATKSK